MTKQDQEFQILFNEARIAGLQAGLASVPMPMAVVEHTNLLNDSSPVKRAWVVDDGVCGFAWITVRPANSTFVRSLEC
jgi:hypothetical protein